MSDMMFKIPPHPIQIVVRELRQTSKNCPSQWDGYTFDERPIYARHRNGDISIAIGFPGDSLDRMLGEARIGYLLKAHTLNRKFDLNIEELFNIFDLLGIDYSHVKRTNSSDNIIIASDECIIGEPRVDACSNLLGVTDIHSGRFITYNCGRLEFQECWNNKDWCPIRK